ncbi:MAG: helix-turn-helix domain-containing protein [Roseburia sp.]|nr:helix-turn-helix domain-containing protein [Roseburia sp.]
MKQTMGEFLETLRKAGGYTQQGVAERLGVSNRTVSSWETDRTAPDLLILPALADLYGVTVDEILRGERKAEASADEISDKARRDLRKRRYAHFITRLSFCLGFGLLGGAIFVAACAVLLYSSAPLWLSVLLMVLGAGGCAACVILLACFSLSAARGEGIVLKEDFTKENKAFALSVRHGAANSLKLLSLPYIAGAIVYLVVFFAAELYDYSVNLGGVSVQIDYTTPTAVLVSLCAAFGLALFLSGLIYHLVSLKNLGDGEQISTLKANGKLFGKVCGFGAIPVIIALILLIVFNCVTVSSVRKVHFTAHSEEEIYRQFQTFKTGGIDEIDTDGSARTILPAGEYYLDFQSEDYVELPLYYRGDEPVTEKFYDLGGGFYMYANYYGYGIYCGNWWEDFYTSCVYEVYYLDHGYTAEDLQEGGEYLKYLTKVTDAIQTIPFPLKDGGVGNAYNVAYDSLFAITSDWNYEIDAPIGRKYSRGIAYYYKEGVWRYEEERKSDYSNLFGYIFLAVTGATAIAGTVAYFIKRKRTEYSF